jgi:iron(III) transport system substrate-binding protein
MKLFFRTSILALTLLAVSCGKKSDTATGSSSPTHIVVYTALEPEEIGTLVPIFEAEHPDIKVDVIRDSSGKIAARLIAEASNPRADVAWGMAATNLLNADRINMLAPYSAKGIDQLSPEFKDSRAEPHWEGIDGYMTAFAVNTIELGKTNTPIPQSYADLAKPIYKGMVIMPNPSESGTGFLTVAGILQIMGEPGGWNYLDQLNQNVVAYTPSGSAPAVAAATGEHPIGVSFDFRILEEKKKGGPLQIVFPAEKSGWEMEANALIQKPDIKPAAKTFIDWAISAPAFKYYSQHFGILANPAFMQPVDGFPARPQDQMIKNNFAWAAENRERILAEWNKRYGGK